MSMSMVFLMAEMGGNDNRNDKLRQETIYIARSSRKVKYMLPPEDAIHLKHCKYGACRETRITTKEKKWQYKKTVFSK